jgi:RHS repeat-associated protein
MGTLRRVFGMLTSASVVAAGIVSVAPPAQAAPAAAHAPEDPGTRPDAASAVVAARTLGRQVEVTDATTSTLRRWANPDGTFTDELSAAPVRTKRADGWVPVDTRLAVRDGAVVANATVGNVRFSAGGDKALASVTGEGGVSVALSWPKPLPAPAVVGDTARYPDVLPGVDLEMKAVAAGYEQSFVLKTRGAAAAALHVPLTARGVTGAAKDGAVVYRDAHGTERAWIGSARMWDAAGHEAPVGVAVAKTANGNELVMRPDAAFMARHDLVYPVTVDPTIQIYRWIDAYIDSTNNTTNYGTNAYLKIGARGTGPTQYVTYIAFGLSAYAGKHITDAYQYMGMTDSVTCSARTTTVYKVTTGWSPGTVTWASHPTTDLTTGGTLATATSAGGGPVGSACASNAWMTFHDSRLTTLYDDWANSRTPNYGMSIRASSTDTTAAKDFASGENGSWTPRVNITYNNYPATAAGRYVTPAIYYDDGEGTRYTPVTTPTVAGGACDPDGDATRVDFEVWDVTKTTMLQSTSSTDATVPSCQRRLWTIPSPLTNGTKYYWRSRVYDGTDYSLAWSSWSPIVVDTTPPPAATVSSTTFTSGQWVTTNTPATTSSTFTLGASPTTDVAGYYYALDDPNPTTYTTGTSATVDVSEGWHTLYVQTADKAGNRSTTTTSFSFGYGQLGMSSPADGTRTSQKLTLSGSANPDVTSLTWQRIDSTGTAVALTQLKDASNNTVTQPISITSGVVPTLTWDAETELGNVPDGPVKVTAVVRTTGSPSTDVPTRTVSVNYDRNDFASVNATTSAGPGAVNLVTGNLQLSDSDASLGAWGSDLSVSRTFNSRDAAASANGPFGPGWVMSGAVDSASSDYVSLAIDGTTATLTAIGGDTIGFTRATTTATTFTPEYGAEDLALTYVSGSPNRYELKDLDGNVTKFTQPGTSTTWVPTSVLQSGDTDETTYAYETVTVNSQSVTRITGMMAPQPPGLSGTCSLASPTSVTGCRSLKLTYNASTVTPPSSGQVGDYPNRLQKVEAIAYDPDLTPTPAMRTVAIASYAYDSNGRLAQAWDPRLSSLKTTYTYNSDGQVATLTPPAEEAWTFAYAPLSTEASGTGRLKSVSRPTLLVSPTTATTTFVYRVPTTGSGAPFDLSSTEVARWGQKDVPSTATAVFPATSSATFGSGSLPVPSSYDRAYVHYLNVDGREVDTADATGGITTTDYDAHGNVVRTLTAGNRQRALDRGTTTAEEAAIAQTLSSLTVYSADGLEVRETFGPEHDVLLTGATDSVRGREHTTNTYDEGTTGGPFHLLTTSATSVRIAGETTDRTSEARTTKTEYGTNTASWTLGKPTATIADAVSGGLNLATRTTYTTDGRVLTQTLPAGGTTTNTASTRVTRYYIAGTGSGDTACDSKPAWVNLVCSVGPGGQPTGTALPTSYTTYDMFNQPRTITEKASGTTLRTTTTTYDAAGRTWKSSVTASTGTSLPTVEAYYDTNGRATETRSLDANGAITARVTRVYDTLGRLTSYTDTDGQTSTTTYDLVGRPLVTSDGKGTQTRTYDVGSEKRGLLTSLVDSHAGTWSATYDVDGTATVDWPNGLRQTSTVGEDGSTTELTYAATSGCTGAACTVFSDSIGLSVHGQWLEHGSTLSSQDYTYDAAGRLTQVADTVDDECTTRRYTFDSGSAGNGNRTKLETFDPGTDGACQTSTASSTVNATFDAADRLTTSGTVYDALGRTTTVPDADALDSGALTVGYHVNDLVRSIAIAGGVTKTYTLDVDQQRVRSWTDGTTTRTNHYDGDADNPSWTAEGGTAWTRNIGGISGDLAAIYDSATSTATLQLTNLHGDVVATASTSSTALASTSEATEYGVPRGATGARYAWLGGKQRAADTPGGLSIMGVRLYNPSTGRFLQTDPVYGGNSNAYTYPNDPLTGFDLDGRWHFKCRWCGAVIKAAAIIVITAVCEPCEMAYAVYSAVSAINNFAHHRYLAGTLDALSVVGYGAGRYAKKAEAIERAAQGEHDAMFYGKYLRKANQGKRYGKTARMLSQGAKARKYGYVAAALRGVSKGLNYGSEIGHAAHHLIRD